MKSLKKKTRKLTRTGKTSYTVNIPKDFVQVLRWKERQKLNVKLVGKKIVVEDWE